MERARVAQVHFEQHLAVMSSESPSVLAEVNDSFELRFAKLEKAVDREKKGDAQSTDSTRADIEPLDG